MTFKTGDRVNWVGPMGETSTSTGVVVGVERGGWYRVLWKHLRGSKEEISYQSHRLRLVTQNSLEQACIDVMNATDSRGLRIMLANPMNINSLRKNIEYLGKDFDSSSWIDANGEEACARNIKLLATCLEQHLIARRTSGALTMDPTTGG